MGRTIVVYEVSRKRRIRELKFSRLNRILFRDAESDLSYVLICESRSICNRECLQ